MMNIVVLYLRSIPTAFRRSHDQELEVVWKFALASIAFIVFALISIVNAILGEADIAPRLLAATACLGISAANGAYVVYAVRRASVADDDGAVPPD